MKFPELDSVAESLLYVRNFILKHGINETDVRLQVWEDGSWTVHSGDSSYDQDHRGAWGSSGVCSNYTLKELRDVADELIEQAREHVVQMGQGDA